MNYPWELSPFAVFTAEGDRDYKKTLADHPEFTLYEHFREGGPTSVKISAEVEKGYLKARLGINESEGEKGRVDLAMTLKNLAAFSRIFLESPADSRCEELIKAFPPRVFLGLVEQLGVPIAKALAEPVAGEKRKLAIGDLAARFKRGLENLEREQSPLLREAPDGRALLPIRQMIVQVAIAQFRRDRKRPTKGRIRSFLEGMGYGFSGKNAKDTWNDHFTKVGLGKLHWE